MKNYLIILLGVSLIAVTNGCASFKTNRIGAPITADVNITLKPKVDIAKKKVSGVATCNAFLGIFTWGVSNYVEYMSYNGQGKFQIPTPFNIAERKAKSGAAYLACKKAGADFLACPQYDIRIENYLIFKIIKCKVSGFPVKVISVEEDKSGDK